MRKEGKVKQLWLIGAFGLLTITTLAAQERRPAATGRKPATTRGATVSGAAASSTQTRTTAAGRAAAPALTPKAKELASYAIGYDLATRLRSEGADVSVESLIRGLQDSFAGAKPAHAQPDLKAAVEAFDADVEARAQVRLQQLSAKHQRDGQEYLAKNKTKRGVKVLPSGVQYEILQQGKGKSPTAESTIRAHYHGTLIDGTVFDSTQNGEPIEIAVQETIPGWADALTKMRVGDKWRLTVPPELAYGAEGFGPVPPSATLVFDIELLDVASPAVQQSARPRRVQ